MSADPPDLRTSLEALAGTGSGDRHGSSAYTGSPYKLLGVSTPELRRLARRWLAADTSRSPKEILEALDGLFASELPDEKTLGALILGYATTVRRETSPSRIDGWLDHLAGWAQIDALG